MPKRKLLIRKEERQYVPELKREVTTAKGWQYYVRDPTKPVQTPWGMISASELKKKSGSLVVSKQGKKFCLLDADFIDDFQRITRAAQVMLPKEIGHIIATTGISKSSIIIDAGTGSGMLACFLAHLCKNVITYDTEEKNTTVAKQNAATLGLKNITFKKGSIYTKIPEKNVDVVVLDVSEPWKAVETAARALRIGGFVVAYTLQATQLQQVANAIQQDKRFLLLKNCELLERQWKVAGDIVRPHNIPIGHTGFLTFARKIC